MAKLHCAQQLQDAVTRALGLAGGRAYLDADLLSWLHREGPWALYAGGTAEIQKEIIARSLNARSHRPTEKPEHA